MGLFSKIKNVLFEEEEIEIPVFTKEETKKAAPISKIEKRVEKPIVREEKKPVVKEVVKETMVKETKKEQIVEDNERETFKSEPTFQFPVFDEKEYNEPQFTRSGKASSGSKNEKIKNNIKKNATKKIDFGRFDEKPKKEEEPKRFVPSPVISPVFGILDKNYSKADMKPQYTKPEKVVDVDSIRNKAYGTLEDEIQRTIEKPVNEFYEEEPTKSINELLNDVIDEEIPLDNIEENNEEESSNIEEVENTKSSLDLLDDIEQEVKREANLEDTLESDLFNLIDSMYTDREEEKE